jgi:RiboL-PSP-HEPN
MVDLTGAIGDFHSDLKRTEDLLALIKGFKVFAGSSERPANPTNSAWPEAADLLLLAPGVRTDLPVLSGSLLLYVSGRFENFVRKVVVEVAEDKIAQCATYDALPVRLKDALFAQTLIVAQSPGKFGFEKSAPEKLIWQLGSSMRPDDGIVGPGVADPLVFDTSVLALTESNMNSRTIVDVMKRVGIEEFWLEIGKQATLKAELGTSNDAECRAAAIAQLDAMMKDRNGFAHPSAEATFRDADQVLATCKFLKVLSQVIVDVVPVLSSSNR